MTDSVFYWTLHVFWVFCGWVGGGANVSTLYNDGQLCIYCLFIVDLYMKRNEYIIYIYLYIMKYYDLVFEVGIETMILFIGLTYNRPFLRCS